MCEATPTQIIENFERVMGMNRQYVLIFIMDGTLFLSYENAGKSYFLWPCIFL